MPDPHAILGVERGADRAAVRAAYREKSKSTHPDAPGGSAEAFAAVRAAYETLMADGHAGAVIGGVSYEFCFVKPSPFKMAGARMAAGAVDDVPYRWAADSPLRLR